MSDAGPPTAPWARAFDWHVSSVAADGAGNVYVQANDTLHAFAPDGRPLWERSSSLRFPRYSLAGLERGVMYAADVELSRLRPDGTVVWSRATGAEDRPNLAVAVNGDRVAVRVSEALRVLDLETGADVWTVATEPVWQRPGAHESIVAPTPDGGFVVTPPLIAFDAEGRLRWRRDIPTSELHALAVADDGTVLVAGAYWFAPDLGLGPLPHAPQHDPYVALFDPDGTPRFQMGFAGVDHEYAYGAAALGNQFLVTGHFGEAERGIQIGDVRFENTGFRDAFLVALDTDGTLEHVSTIAGPANVDGRVIGTTPSGRWIVGGVLGGELELAGDLLDSSNHLGGFVWVGAEL